MPYVIKLALYSYPDCQVVEGHKLIKEDETIIANRISLSDVTRVWASNSDMGKFHDQLVELVNKFVESYSKKPHKNRKIRTIQHLVKQLTKILEDRNHGNQNHSKALLQRQGKSVKDSRRRNRISNRSPQHKSVAIKEPRGRKVYRVADCRADRVGKDQQQAKAKGRRVQLRGRKR